MSLQTMVFETIASTDSAIPAQNQFKTALWAVLNANVGANVGKKGLKAKTLAQKKKKSLFVPQCVDRVKARCPHGRVQTGKQTDANAHDQSEPHPKPGHHKTPLPLTHQ